MIGTFVTLAGFVCQFIGLRELYWSATIVQLGVTVIVTGIRSFVRRDLGQDIDTLDFPYAEINHVALFTGNLCLSSDNLPGKIEDYILLRARLRWEIPQVLSPNMKSDTEWLSKPKNQVRRTPR